MHRYVESYASDDATISLEGRTYPDPCLIEDEDGYRWYLTSAPNGILPGAWVKASAAGVVGLLWPHDAGWIAATTEEFIAYRTEVNRTFHFDGGVSFSSPPSYREMVFYERPQTPASGFVHLHTHSEMSALDGRSTVKEIVAQAQADDQFATSVTDHGNCAAHFDLHKEAERAQIKPIYGIEAYFVHDRFRRAKIWYESPEGLVLSSEAYGELSVAERKNLTKKTDAVEVKNSYHHLILLAQTQQGLRNVWGASTEAYRDGFYYYPKMDWETLRRHSEGVICSTGCLRGPIAGPLLEGDTETARVNLGRLWDIFGENLYLELHANSLPEQEKVNRALVELGHEYGVPTIAVVDSHYPTKDAYLEHQVWISVQTNSDIQDEGDLFSHDIGLYMKTQDEVRQSLSYLDSADLDAAIANTVRIAESCEAEITTKKTIPVFSRQQSGESVEEVRERDIDRLIDLCLSNWHLTEGPGKPPQEDYIARFELEMGLIIPKGFSGYYLQVSDYVAKMKSQNVLVGPGRGCLVGETPVRTDRGFIPLSEVEHGDLVVSHTGSVLPVIETHRYEVDESLVKVRTYYDDGGVTMTPDHLVWAEKATHETDRKRLAQGYRYFPPSGSPEWIRADELEVGDLVVVPISEVDVSDVQVIDLADYADENSSVTDEWIIEDIASNDLVPWSIRGVHRISGLSRNALRAARDGSPRTTATTKSRILETVRPWFDSVEDWATACRALASTTRRVRRFIEVDDDFCWLMGALISNGWLRRKDLGEIGLATQLSTHDGACLRLGTVFGLECSLAPHADRDLLQVRVQSRAVREFIRREWSGYDFTAQTKSIPNWLMTFPENKRRKVLEGLWWGDGSESTKTTYSTSSPRLRDQVRTLLWSLGHPAGCRTERRFDRRTEFYGEHLSYTITTSSGFSPQKNQNGAEFPGFLMHRIWEVGEDRSHDAVYDITVPGDHSYSTGSFAVHNSGGGSLVAYLSQITGIDPVEADLDFFRFMTEGRTALPDFDVDFPASKRPLIQDYISERYGEEHVVRIGNHIRTKNKGILRDISRAMKSQLPETAWRDFDEISKIIDAAEAGTAGLGLTWEELWAQEEELLSPYRDKYPDVFSYAEKLVGRLKSYGKHPAGLVVSEDVLTDALPLRIGEDENSSETQMVTQFDMVALEEMGYIKFDILTLRTLDTIQQCVDLIEERRGIRIDPYTWKEEYFDPQVWEMISEGQTLGVFQVETAGGQRMCKQVRPSNLAEFADVLTLVRPGPMRSGLTQLYLDRRDGKSEVTYPDPRLEKVLKPTYGAILYQEQVMQTCMILAGYDSNKADEVRKILGKKKVDKVASAGQEFVAGCVEYGMDASASEQLWEQLAEFARYSFGKAHAFGYAVLAYWTAWLKIHYPVECFTSLLSTIKQERIPEFVSEARRFGFKIAPPDVNESKRGFTAIELGVRYGLDSLKGVGASAVDKILPGQPYTSFEDFRERSGADSGVTRILARIGAFDSLGENRRGLEQLLEGQKTGQHTRCVFKVEDLNEHGLPCTFDWASEPLPINERTGRTLKPKPIPKRCTVACRQYVAPPAFEPQGVEPYTEDDIRDIEMEMLGIHLSSTVFDRLDPEDRQFVKEQAEALKTGGEGSYFLAAMVSKSRKHIDKSGADMGFITLVTEVSDLDVVVFKSEWAKFALSLKVGRLAYFEIYKTDRGLNLKHMSLID